MGFATDNHTQRCVHRRAVAKKAGKCGRCPPHGGENRKRPDKHRQKRKPGRVRFVEAA